MSNNQYSVSAQARGDLQAARRARLAANTSPQAYPWWWAPVAGVTHGAGMALVTGPLPYRADGAAWKFAAILGTIAALSVFPAMCAVRVLRMRVRARPSWGTTRQRTLLEGVPVAAYAVAGLVFLAWGGSAGPIALGVLGGGSLWWRESRKKALLSESAAALQALGRTE